MFYSQNRALEGGVMVSDSKERKPKVNSQPKSKQPKTKEPKQPNIKELNRSMEKRLKEIADPWNDPDCEYYA